MTVDLIHVWQKQSLFLTVVLQAATFQVLIWSWQYLWPHSARDDAACGKLCESLLWKAIRKLPFSEWNFFQCREEKNFYSLIPLFAASLTTDCLETRLLAYFLCQNNTIRLSCLILIQVAGGLAMMRIVFDVLEITSGVGQVSLSGLWPKTTGGQGVFWMWLFGTAEAQMTKNSDLDEYCE